MFVAAIRIDLITPNDPIFMQALLRNATASRRERGCRRFDVSVTTDGVAVFLYEVYEDSAAFQTHRSTAHFTEYDRITQPLIRNKNVQTYTLKWTE